MIRDFAKTSPVTFFALPIIIIGLLMLSYFLYSTILNQQINSRSQYLSRQVKISIDNINEQVEEFEMEIPNLAQIDDFDQVFDPDPTASSKLRYRIKRIARRYKKFVDTLYVYNRTNYYFITVNERGEIEEGFDSLYYLDVPVQFSKRPKIVHIEGNKSLAVIPIDISNKDQPIYVASLFNVFNLIGSHSQRQYIGDFGYKFVFSENNGFRLAEKGTQVEYDFSLMKRQRQRVINDLLKYEQGEMIHAANNQGQIFLTAYRPFDLFSERYGLMFSVSESDFITPIRSRLQIVFLSFFIIIGVIIVVFIINLRDISRNNEEIESSREGLANALSILEAQQETSRDAILIGDEEGNLISYNQKAIALFNLEEEAKKGVAVDRIFEFINAQLVQSTNFFVDNQTEEYSAMVELKSNTQLEYYTSIIKDETEKYNGRIWTFRLL